MRKFQAFFVTLQREFFDRNKFSDYYDMKHRHYLLYIAAFACLLPSCSLFNKTAKTGSEVHSVTIDGKKGTAAANLEAPEGNIKKLGKMPSDDQLTGGRWTLVSVGDRTVNAEDEQPYIHFDGRGRFYAGDGCNIINGDYTLRTNGRMAFANVLSTMKYCPDLDYAPAIAAILADGSVYDIDCRKIGQDTYLYFKNDAGKTAVTYRRHNMEFLNGLWTITYADGKKINDPEVNIFIDIAELKLHGNTGCNYFNGDIYIDPGRSNAVDFSNMGLTRMACEKSDREQRIMVALEQAVTAIAGKKENTVLLLDSKGKEVMTLKRVIDNND